jgi:hypothetical protein
MCFLNELKEARIIKIQWHPMDKNDVDIFTRSNIYEAFNLICQ